jgi:hypothetical protein
MAVLSTSTVNFVIESMKSIGSRPKNPKTDFEHALSKMYDGIQRARTSMEKADDLIIMPSATKDSMIGHVQSAKKALEAVWKSSGKALIGEFYNPSWVVDYENAMNSIGSVVDNDVSAIEYIKRGYGCAWRC